MELIKTFFIFLFLFFTLFSSNAQLKIESTGKAKIGKVTPSTITCDPDNVATMMLFGSLGDYRNGTKLTFGDFGRQSSLGWNVFIGEYGTTDTDQLWLHGKNGLYLTYGQGLSNQIIGYYNVSNGNRFNFNCEVYSNGVKLASDERFKENINELSNSLSSLNKLVGVSYNLNESTINSTASDKGKNLLQANNSNSSDLSEKEKKDKAFFEQREQELSNNKKKHMGFVAQDLQKIFPELVEEGKDGYLYVDYIGLIPVIVEGLKEQNSIIEAQSRKIKELESQINNSGKMTTPVNPPVLKSAASSTQIQAINENTDHAFLYQNTPNPFTNQTEISYFLPKSIKNAYICIFDMQGSLIKKIPISNEGSIQINGSELKAGMYIYSLIANGQEVDTKRMILTK